MVWKKRLRELETERMSLEKIKLKWIMWIAEKLPPCKAITEMVSQSLEQRLTISERLKVRLHFMICVWCARYEQQLLALRHSLRRYAQQSETDDSLPSLTPEARERIRRSFNRDR